MQGNSSPGAVLDAFVRLQAGTVTADMIKQWKEHFEGQNVINGQCRGGGVTLKQPRSGRRDSVGARIL